MKQIGLFFGSFNPVHIGHLALANYMCEFEAPEEVWFVVSPQNPFKEADDLIDVRHRLKMARMATDNYASIKVEDIELSLPTPSYTIQTLKTLEIKHPDCRFSLIMGADNIEHIGRWKDAEQIIDNHPILVYPRMGHPTDKLNLPDSVKLTAAPCLEVSSSAIRTWIRAGKSLPFFTTPRVKDYIYINHLYR